MIANAHYVTFFSYYVKGMTENRHNHISLHVYSPNINFRTLGKISQKKKKKMTKYNFLQMAQSAKNIKYYKA